MSTKYEPDWNEGERLPNGDIIGQRCSDEEREAFLATKPLEHFKTEALEKALEDFPKFNGGMASYPVFTKWGYVQLTADYVPAYGGYQKYIHSEEIRAELARRKQQG